MKEGGERERCENTEEQAILSEYRSRRVCVEVHTQTSKQKNAKFVCVFTILLVQYIYFLGPSMGLYLEPAISSFSSSGANFFLLCPKRL